MVDYSKFFLSNCPPPYPPGVSINLLLLPDAGHYVKGKSGKAQTAKQQLCANIRPPLRSGRRTDASIRCSCYPRHPKHRRGLPDGLRRQVSFRDPAVTPLFHALTYDWPVVGVHSAAAACVVGQLVGLGLTGREILLRLYETPALLVPVPRATAYSTYPKQQSRTDNQPHSYAPDSFGSLACRRPLPYVPNEGEFIAHSRSIRLEERLIMSAQTASVNTHGPLCYETTVRLMRFRRYGPARLPIIYATRSQKVKRIQDCCNFVFTCRFHGRRTFRGMGYWFSHPPSGGMSRGQARCRLPPGPRRLGGRFGSSLLLRSWSDTVTFWTWPSSMET